MLNVTAISPEQPGPFDNLAQMARYKIVNTLAGQLLLHDCCPSSLIENLRADDGLRAFARRPEREHKLLLDIAKKPENKLTIAYTPAGDIVSQVTLAPADACWGNTEHTYEVAIEVSTGWRRRGIAHTLLAYALELDTLEKMILVGMGLHWHWDIEDAGLHIYQYREMIARLFATCGFTEYLTTEPNIRMSPANIFVARIGKYVDRDTMNTFFERLLQSETLPGL